MSLLSIVIPTKNRQKYCVEAVKSVVDLSNEDIQIVIQDNSDDDSLRGMISLISYNNCKYNYHPGVLSFVDNFSEALDFSDGDYICMIGDDDAVLPSVIQAVEIMKKDSLDALIPGLNSVYFWPSEKTIIKGAESGYLCIANIQNQIKTVDSEKGLIDLIKNGGQDYQSLNVPRIYHGLVKRSVLEEIKKQTGKYFDGLTPDIYMSVALSLVCKNCRRIYYPITVSGICPRSGSADSATGKHTGQLRDAPHFRGHNNYTWDSKAPSIYSVESIWAETVLHALKNFHRDDLYNKFNVCLLDAICLSKYPQFTKEIKSHLSSNNISLLKADLLKIILHFKKPYRRAISLVRRSPGSVTKHYNVENISAAVSYTMESINKYIN